MLGRCRAPQIQGLGQPRKAIARHGKAAAARGYQGCRIGQRVQQIARQPLRRFGRQFLNRPVLPHNRGGVGLLLVSRESQPDMRCQIAVFGFAYRGNRSADPQIAAAQCPATKAQSHAVEAMVWTQRFGLSDRPRGK
jgi:hypothetical protein